jgi:acetyl-CoA carboxylase carboxyltransferase component
MDAQPGWNSEIVTGFLRMEDGEILVIADQSIKLAAGHDSVNRELPFQRRPPGFLFLRPSRSGKIQIAEAEDQPAQQRQAQPQIDGEFR